jgi:hypothetical protein
MEELAAKQEKVYLNRGQQECRRAMKRHPLLLQEHQESNERFRAGVWGSTLQTRQSSQPFGCAFSIYKKGRSCLTQCQGGGMQRHAE